MFCEYFPVENTDFEQIKSHLRDYMSMVKFRTFHVLEPCLIAILMRLPK